MSDPKMTAALRKKLDSLPSTSARIKFLATKKGWTRGQIHRLAGLKTRAGNPLRYQHIRNVLVEIGL